MMVWLVRFSQYAKKGYIDKYTAQSKDATFVREIKMHQLLNSSFNITTKVSKLLL